MTNQVEYYNSTLMSKKEQLEKCRMKLQRSLKDSHVTELVLQKVNITKDLRELLHEQPTEFEYSNTLMIVPGKI